MKFRPIMNDHAVKNLHAGGRWETMNFLGVALKPQVSDFLAICTDDNMRMYIRMYIYT